MSWCIARVICRRGHGYACCAVILSWCIARVICGRGHGYACCAVILSWCCLLSELRAWLNMRISTLKHWCS